LLDQKRNLSIFRSLGFQYGEISRSWFVQTLTQFIISVIIGIPCGILLSKFKKNQKIDNLVDTLQVTYDLLLKGHLSQSFNDADILFYRDLKTGMTENGEKKMAHLFEL
jgi:ABC-type antimicrobial peptide transport system permease subunit